jgi:hypothetical protein
LGKYRTYVEFRMQRRHAADAFEELFDAKLDMVGDIGKLRAR